MSDRTQVECTFSMCPFGLAKPHNIGDHPFDLSADPGIYPKYLVFRFPKDWEENWGKYELLDDILEEVDAFCFVLKVTDKHARIAMAAYAESVKDEKPQLSRDLYEILGDF